jgi:hypothetical protein
VDAADVLFRRGHCHHARGDHDRADADWRAHLRIVAELGEVSPYAAEIAELLAAPAQPVPTGHPR